MGRFNGAGDEDRRKDERSIRVVPVDHLASTEPAMKIAGRADQVAAETAEKTALQRSRR